MKTVKKLSICLGLSSNGEVVNQEGVDGARLRVRRGILVLVLH